MKLYICGRDFFNIFCEALELLILGLIRKCMAYSNSSTPNNSSLMKYEVTLFMKI